MTPSPSKATEMPTSRYYMNSPKKKISSMRMQAVIYIGSEQHAFEEGEQGRSRPLQGKYDDSAGCRAYQIQRNLINKKQLEFIVQADLERMIKIKDGELRSKLDILNNKMQKFDLFGQPEDEEKKKMEEEIAKKVI